VRPTVPWVAFGRRVLRATPALQPRQSGQTLIMFALTLSLVFVGLLALVGDSAVLLYQYNKANAAALLGVQAGASAVDLNAFYQSGARTLDAGTAETECRQTAEQASGGTATCTVQGNQVTAQVDTTVGVPVPVFGASFNVQVTQTGQAVFGGAAPCNGNGGACP
jgi:hypothetical protein